MSSQDDPEARIRELERSLADRTTELTHDSYYSAPPPVVPATRTTGGLRSWWLVAVVLTVLGIMGIGTAAYQWANTFSDDSTVAGGGTFGEAPSSTGGPSVSSVPDGGNVSVSGVGDDKTFECNDAVVTISGVSNTVLITGHCLSISVSGVQNIVTVDAVDTIGASGFDNRITFRTGDPEIQNSGAGNVVERG